MTAEQKKARLRKLNDVRCQGCGRVITPDDDLENVEYVKSKRGTEYFFHTRCTEFVWGNEIV